ncbi:hypothetical protein BRD17_02925 [Halobacteriales archaeon SW_7_68_16]|nr:MAG: hypothetical protein BRD17_02925 [Halobacteriales archaeon SW_7_68_16]
MSVSSLCSVCEAAEASDRCGQCGAFACDDHFDDDLGVCVECAATRPDGEDRPADGSGHDGFEGGDTHQF